MQRKICLRIGYCLLATGFIFSLGLNQTTITSKDSVSIVKNGKWPSPPAGAATKLVLDPIFTIGDSNNPEQKFSLIIGIAISKTGTVYVLDRKENQVKAFDKKGRFLFSFGNRGQGPGEFNGPLGIMISAEDEIVINDRFNYRLEFFNLDGKYLRSQPLGQDMDEIIMSPEGRVASRIITYSPADFKSYYEFMIFDADLKPLKSLAKVVFAAFRSKKFDPITNTPGFSIASDAKGNLFLGSTKGYLINVFDFDGRLIRTINREYIPIPLKESDEVLKNYDIRILTGGPKVVFPHKYPAYNYFIANPDGQLLVKTFEKGPEAKSYFYDVFDQAGRYFSRVSLRNSILAWQEEKLFTLEVNEEGFHILKCFRARWEK